MNPGGLLSLRELVEKHHAALAAHLLDELSAHVDSRLTAARDETAAAERSKAESEKEQTVSETRTTAAESLNQAVRRIRQAAGEAVALRVLLEASAPWARQVVVLRTENNQAEIVGSRGLDINPTLLRLDSAAALLSVCQTKEPIVALAMPSEISQPLADALAGPGAPPKLCLFPVIARDEAVAILLACGDTVPPALELLTEACGMKIESLEAPVAPLKPLPAPGLIQIAAPETQTFEKRKPGAWSDLSPDDQKLHLQAQRVARVKVAEMRLYHAEQLRKGVFEANIYAELGNEIDRARAEFLEAFLSKSPTMVDYLHLELLRSLAHDDDRLLGQDYPGPMV